MVRVLCCAVAMILAAPALAGERLVYAPAPDTLSLLMADQRATFSAPTMIALPQVRSFDMRESEMTELVASSSRIDLSGFESLPVAALADRSMPAAWRPDAASPFSLADIPIWRRSFSLQAGDTDGGRVVVRDTINTTRIFRRPRALDATLVLRLDGNEDSAPLSVGGGITGALWQAIPKN